MFWKLENDILGVLPSLSIFLRLLGGRWKSSAVGCFSSQAGPGCQVPTPTAAGGRCEWVSCPKGLCGSEERAPCQVPPSSGSHYTFWWGFEDLTICGLVWPFLSPKGLYNLMTQLSYTLDIPFLLMSVYRAVPANVCTKGEKEGTLGTQKVGFSCCPYVLGSVGCNTFLPNDSGV